MNTNQIRTRSHLDGSAENWVGRRKPKLKLRRPEPTVVLVDGQECLRVPLTKEQFAIVDKSDAMLISGINWYAFKWTYGFYAARKIRPQSGVCVTQFMHNLIVPCPIGFQPDHKNGNGLDNRRCNLRAATISEQRANSRKRINPTSSQNLGVHWLNRERRWRARIQYHRQDIVLGYFKTESEAVTAYREAASRLFGEFAVHNREKLSEQLTNPEQEQKGQQCIFRL